MSPLWLCLFFTYLFTTHAIEKTDDGDVFEEKPSTHLEDLGSSQLINRILSSFLSENTSDKDEDNLQESFRSIKLPGSSVIKEIANATENVFNATDNFFQDLIQPMLSNLTPKRKRQAELSNDQLNVDKNLPINRLLDATDKLFNQTAFIDKMLDKERNTSEKKYEHVYIDNRDLTQDHEFTPIQKEDDPKEVDSRYSALLEKIFTNPLKSDSKLPPNDSVQSVNNQKEPKQKLTAGSRFLGLSKNNQKINGRSDGGPLVSAASFMIEKIKNVILNVVQKLQDDKKISGRIFAVSALTSFVLSVGVSATKAFYTGYVVCETICRFLTGKDGLVTCNLFDIFAFPIRIITNSISKISNLFTIGKSLIKFPLISQSFLK